MDSNTTDDKVKRRYMNRKFGGAFVITIDGPAGSGKSTVSGKLARRLNMTFLTTGSFYRGLAELCKIKKIDITDEVLVASLAHYQGFRIHADMYGTQVFIDDVNVTAQINNDETAKIASRISAYSQVRKALLEAQREFNKPPAGLIAEGRDCGTVVFPDADVKIFLTASLDMRAQRRSSEYKSTSEELIKNIAQRDEADSQRKVAPMAKAHDAIEIDTSTLSIDEVVDKIVKVVESKKSQ
ncbi:MAG: (d)CMP kinase [Oligoflexia bacterium]|nr:(d)CMP kinase [Oligoflexia bacterium]